MARDTRLRKTVLIGVAFCLAVQIRCSGAQIACVIGEGNNITSANCSASASHCYSLMTSSLNNVTGAKDLQFKGPENSTWPNTITDRGCYDRTRLSLYLECPPPMSLMKNSTQISLIPEYLGNVAVLQNATQSVVFYQCCNNSLCNNISLSSRGATDSFVADADDIEAADFFGESPVVQPLAGSLEFMDLIILAVIALISISLGLVVDFAATGRGPFKDS